jgi:hypothetical protein
MAYFVLGVLQGLLAHFINGKYGRKPLYDKHQ